MWVIDLLTLFNVDPRSDDEMVLKIIFPKLPLLKFLARLLVYRVLIETIETVCYDIRAFMMKLFPCSEEQNSMSIIFRYLFDLKNLE